MKTTYFKVFFVLFAFTLLLISSCSNPCKDKDCANGTCNKADGSCDCDPGWLRDATGKCGKEDLCYNKDCGHGTCVPADGTCICDAGWFKDATGKCTIPNPCVGVDCGTYGVCDTTNGACSCLPGYEVNAAGKCEVVSRDKFIGTYVVLDICTSGSYNYTATITAGVDGINSVIINHYGGYEIAGSGYPLSVKATINGNIISVSAQTILFNGSYFSIYPASGTISGNTFTMNQTVAIDGGSPEVCATQYNKQ